MSRRAKNRNAVETASPRYGRTTMPSAPTTIETSTSLYQFFVALYHCSFAALYQFVCFLNGLAPCPRKLTELLKPFFSLLRQQGHISVAYIDNSWLTADNLSQCTKNVIDTTSLLDKVGFVIHPEKSVLLLTQIITFLGFVLNSIVMQVSLTPDRALKLKDTFEKLLDTVSPSMKDVAQVVGLMTSSFPGVRYCPFHDKFLDMDKM